MLDTRELGHRPGTQRKVSRVVAAPEGLGTDVIGVRVGSDLQLELRLEAVMEGVLVSGSVRGHADGECVRCLAEVEREFDVALQELYVYPGRAPEESEGEDELRELDDELIDLVPALRDTVVPALPFRPLCRADCPGLCPECGARLADDPEHGHERTDPRWAALADLGSASSQPVLNGTEYVPSDPSQATAPATSPDERKES